MHIYWVSLQSLSRAAGMMARGLRAWAAVAGGGEKGERMSGGRDKARREKRL